MEGANRILVVQMGVNANEAKVFKAHAARQGLCENLINAIKLLANQQKDGDSPIQSIVKGLHERYTRKKPWTGYEVSSKQTSTVRWMWIICAKAQGRLSRSRISVRTTRRRPSEKEQMS